MGCVGWPEIRKQGEKQAVKQISELPVSGKTQAEASFRGVGKERDLNLPLGNGVDSKNPATPLFCPAHSCHSERPYRASEFVGSRPSKMSSLKE